MKPKKSDKLIFPSKINENLAELVGIHFGDGSMDKCFNYTYRILYSLNLRDIDYSEYVKSLFYALFNYELRSSIYKSKNTITLYCYSKALCTYFNEFLKVPYSPKTNLRIPGYIKSDYQLAAAFIRGLFDTDGCFTAQRDRGYEYPLIKICTSSKFFACDIKSLLSMLNIKSFISYKPTGCDVVVRRKESYNLFLKLIKPKNKRGCNGATGTFNPAQR